MRDPNRVHRGVRVRAPGARFVPGARLASCVVVACLSAALGAAPPMIDATAPATWIDLETSRDAEDAVARIRSALERRGAMPSIEATFKQTRMTPLLARPIESTGTVRHVQGITLWITESPRRSKMRITEREVEFLYFDEEEGDGGAVHEVHALDERSAALAAIGPEPDLDRIVRLYVVADDADLLGDRDPEAWLAIRLTPRDRDERSSIRAISLLVDLARGLIVRVVTHDLDGGSTSTEFVEIDERPDLTVDDVALNAPAALRSRTSTPPASTPPTGGVSGSGGDR